MPHPFNAQVARARHRPTLEGPELEIRRSQKKELERSLKPMTTPLTWWVEAIPRDTQLAGAEMHLELEPAASNQDS